MKRVVNIDLHVGTWEPGEDALLRTETKTFVCGEYKTFGGRQFLQEVALTNFGVEIHYYDRMNSIDTRIVYPWHRVLAVRDLGDGRNGWPGEGEKDG